MKKNAVAEAIAEKLDSFTQWVALTWHQHLPKLTIVLFVFSFMKNNFWHVWNIQERVVNDIKKLGIAIEIWVD